MNLDDLVSEVRDALLTKKISEEAAANMTATFTEAIKKKDEEYRNELLSAKEAAEGLEKERTELKASVEEVQKQLADALSKISEFETEKKTAQALARFNSRMEEIDQMFDLDDEDRRILVDDIKSLDESEESFASFKNKLSVIWRSKNKEAKSEIEKQVQAKIEEEVQKRLELLKNSNASTTNSVEQILDKAKPVNAELPNNNQQSSEAPQSLVQKFAEAFRKENILIS
jgi:predicted transcriptional regulator